jgi:hypothetical protein
MTSFEFGVGTYPTLAMRSRAHREGVYAGKHSGKYDRVHEPRAIAFEYPFGMQVKALNRKQRKQLKLSEGEMW